MDTKMGKEENKKKNIFKDIQYISDIEIMEQ